MFDSGGEQVRLNFKGDLPEEELAKLFSDPDSYRFYQYGAHQLLPIEQVRRKKMSVELVLLHEPGRIEEAQSSYGLIVIKAVKPVQEPLLIERISISSFGKKKLPEYVGSGEQELFGDKLYPFGERLNLYQDFYVGGSHVLGKKNALIRLEFTLSYENRSYEYTAEEALFELKAIRKKPGNIMGQKRYEAAADSISIDYFNGLGWRRLPCEKDWAGLFNGSIGGHIAIDFTCPEDMTPASTGGYEGCVLRFRILRSDNCYMMPCVHLLPVIEGLRLSYSYETRWVNPDRVRILYGTELLDITEELQRGGKTEAFRPLPYEGNGLYLGFDKKFLGGPISILFQLKESAYMRETKIGFEYSTINGFKQMKIIDHTDHMTESGTVLFMPPPDMAQIQVAGQRRYWLRLTDLSGRYTDKETYHPVIEKILPNAVQVKNMETRPEEEYFIEGVAPDMEFNLDATHILDAEVYVNEKSRYTQAMMHRMAEDLGSRVRAEYDFLGEIQKFYVKWEEVPDFRKSGPLDRHYMIDRMKNTILFGNGTRGLIPMERFDAAFTVSLRRCQGTDGNVEAGAIHSPAGNLMFIEQVENPVGTYGGSDIESLLSALKRGANELSLRGRLVTAKDFLRQLRAASDVIDKASYIIGCDREGCKREGQINLVLLMKDYKEGAYSFHRLKDYLRGQLLSQCELSLRAEEVVVTEPLYVNISVEAWVELNRIEEAFETQNRLLEAVQSFIEPLSEDKKPGWEIGVLPRENQIKMMLYALPDSGRIRNVSITAGYLDRSGHHECSLNCLRDNPFAIGVNGSHKIHLVMPK